ncbi:MAG: carbohydrate-binding domain-containing protein, partial [Clostridia bacterium]|nr:carbohydrate-binding domain-containing protein [Clostridia bacterium]
MKKASVKNIITALLFAVCAALLLAGCSEGGTSVDNSEAFDGQPTVSNGVYGEESVEAASAKYTDYDLDATWDSSATVIALLGDTAEVSGKGAEVSGSTVNIVQEGTYVFSGTLDDGQIVVSVEKVEKVHIVLNGASVTCSDSSALYIMSADKVCITSVKDTVNSFTDGAVYNYGEGEVEHNSCVYSKDDLTLNG